MRCHIFLRIGPNVKIPSEINLPLKTFLIIGDTRMAKMRKYWKKYGIKIPSDKLIKEKEAELMIKIDHQEPEGMLFLGRAQMQAPSFSKIICQILWPSQNI